MNGIGPNDTRFDSPATANLNFGHTITGNVITNGGQQIYLGSGVYLYAARLFQLEPSLPSN